MTDTWWCRTTRDVVVVHGPDAAAYLQSQLSQDLAGLDIGASRWSFVLAPDGKVDALVRVLRLAADRFALDVDAGYGDALTARLRRFLIRTKADVEQSPWACIAVRGPGAAAVSAVVGHRVVSWWESDRAVDVIGPDPRAPAGVAEVGGAELEVARVEAGWPAMGTEIRPGESIPAETGLVDVAVSFTKGCYPGQELVERMHARHAQPPRYVRRLEAGAPLTEGAEVEREGHSVGRVTSAAGVVGLAVVARAVQPGDVVRVDGHSATVHPLVAR
jgi:folate-binding protein YgfZ